MSLVGSLEDLSLGDILQIISLSQKSGVLVLQTTGSDGRIVFRSGLVRGAAIKGGPQDLRGVLVAGGFLSEEEFEEAARQAKADGSSAAAVVSTRSTLSNERIDSLCREAIESAVVTMFSWTAGNFSFDVRNESEPSDPELLLPTGINAQYLAMEGARVSDEGGLKPQGEGESAETAESEVSPGFDEMSAHEIFGVTPDPDEGTEEEPHARGGVPEAVDSLALAAAERAGELEVDGCDRSDPAESAQIFEAEGMAESFEDPEVLELQEPVDSLPYGDALIVGDLLEAEAIDEPVLLDLPEADVVYADPAETNAAVDARALEADSTHESKAVLEAEPASSSPATEGDAAQPQFDRAVVVLDNDLVALEWVKDSVKDAFSQVHIFQHADQALSRIRQYLVRGEPPVILISPEMTVDPLGGIRDVADFVSRLKTQSSRVVALWLCEDGSDSVDRLGRADGDVTRPERNQLRLAQAPELLDQQAGDFATRVVERIHAAQASTGDVDTSSGPEISPDVLRHLRDATRALTEASSRGEVLPLVIRFAADTFNRVAMFMIRDGMAVGMAGKRLPVCNGPDDLALREIRFEAERSAWMSAVLKDSKPVTQPPGSEGDKELAELLGDTLPGCAYLAPIESAGQVIALLYGDNLPDDTPIGDTSTLEVVLHHAGLALDRAALERALREGDG